MPLPEIELRNIPKPVRRGARIEADPFAQMARNFAAAADVGMRADPVPNPARAVGLNRVEIRMDDLDLPRWEEEDAPIVRDWPAPKKETVKERKNMLVHQYFEIPPINCDEVKFGVEVEVEGKNLPMAVAGFSLKQDGSLRGESGEYIFNKASTMTESLALLKKLEIAMKDSELDMSFRTSVHVHVNVLEFDKMQLVTFLYLSFLFENALVNFSGENRVGNRFCLRSSDSYYKVDEMEYLIQQEGFRVMDNNKVKYSAINLACLRRLGTIEFRSMRGTISYKVLSKWLSILKKLFDKSRTFKTPLEVVQKLKELGPVAFGVWVFEDDFKDLNYPGFDEDVRQAFSLFINIPYMVE